MTATGRLVERVVETQESAQIAAIQLKVPVTERMQQLVVDLVQRDAFVGFRAGRGVRIWSDGLIEFRIEFIER